MLTIKNAYFIRGDQIQNWFVSDIEWDENCYTIELSRMHGADVIDLNIKIKRDRTDIGLYVIWTWFQGSHYQMAVTKSDIQDRSLFRHLIYYNLLKNIDVCLQ